MKSGGIYVSKESDRAVRLITLFATPLFVAHGLLATFQVVPSQQVIGEPLSLSILAIWLTIGLYHYFMPVRSRFDLVIRFMLYQAFALATIMAITGFMQPFAVSVVLLFLAAHIYFGKIGFILSVSAVIIAALFDALIRVSFQPDILLANGLGLVAILALGISIVAVISSQETRRRTLQRSQKQERLQADRVVTIMNNLTDATFSTDSRGKVVMYNAACLNLLDTNQSLKGRQISELFSLAGDDGEPVALFDLMSAAQTSTRRSDVRHNYSDGEQIRLELTFAPIKSSFGDLRKGSQLQGYVVIARDVTKEKSLEEERDEFISVVSHELRTPITIVEGSLSNLQVLVSRPQPPTQSLLNTTLETAHQQVLYLAKMVNDLSTLSRAERGVADGAEVIDVAEMMQRLHHQYQKDASASGLHLNLDIAPSVGVVHASRLYLEELLQNFITNAIKYTHKGTVTVSVSIKKGAVTFAVKDTGIGISRSEQKKIFNKFYRSEDYRIRETNGTGLGLYVSAKLSHKLGTQIVITSRLNHGSTFSFSLPVYDQPAESAPKA
jgi:PAS domain S-box-containing protein